MTVGCPSVCLSHRSTAATAPCEKRYQSTTAGTVLRAPEMSSKCGQLHVESRRWRLNTELIYSNVPYSLTHPYLIFQLLRLKAKLFQFVCHRQQLAVSNDSLQTHASQFSHTVADPGWLGSRVVSLLDSRAEGPRSNRTRDAVE